MTTAAPIAITIPGSPTLANLAFGAMLLASLTLIGLDVWKTRRLSEALDTAQDDADYAARRSDVIAEKVAEVCDYLAVADEGQEWLAQRIEEVAALVPAAKGDPATSPTLTKPDTVRSPRVDVAGGARVRPTPQPRTKGRHVA